MIPLDTLNLLVGIGTLGLQVVTAAIAIAYALRTRFPILAEAIRPIGAWGIWIALAASLGATAMSLYYELVVGYEPCVLCWWQRVVMYPQVVIFAVALVRRDTRASAILYSVILSAIGLVIGIYNHLLQVLPGAGLPCPATGTVSCAKILYLELGYITFPMLAITFFAFLIVLMFVVRDSHRA